MRQTIPVLSLADFVNGNASARQRFVAGIGSALSEIGFFALENHGIPSETIRDAYAVAEEFFFLPEAKKVPYDQGKGGQRGYTSFGKEHAKNSDAPDLKEFWHVGREFPAGKLPAGVPGNIWPTEIPGFRAKMLALYDKLDECTMHLLDAISLYIDKPEHFLRDAATDGNNVLRIIHYPPVPADRNPKSIRAAAHEDINLITLLCESTASGLEILKKDGTWLPIHSVKGQIIVDAGDMLQLWTNGLVKSTTHRVVNPGNSRERRYSMPFFVHPRNEVKLADGVTAGEYLERRLREIGLY